MYIREVHLKFNSKKASKKRWIFFPRICIVFHAAEWNDDEMSAIKIRSCGGCKPVITHYAPPCKMIAD